MPAYLRFVRGVVDSSDLPLNVSREILQSNKDVDAIRAGSTKKVLSLLEELAENDKDKYAKFWGQFGQVLKEGIGEDQANRERIAKLLRFTSTHSEAAGESEGQTVSLADYVSRMKEGQDRIWHVTAETFLAAKNSPHLEVFRKHEKIHSCVLLMLGFPGETMRMIFDTIKVARTMDLDWYRISPLQPLPNTPIYDSMIARGLIDHDTSKVVFQGGAYGKQVQIEQGFTLSTANFKEAFKQIPMNSIPTQEQITDIWFYMNYHLNFHRLFHETRPVKLKQQVANLNNLTDVIAPENGFALYFLGVMQYHMEGKIDPKLIDRLKRRLATSPYWKDRLEAFGLRATDLETLSFEMPEKAGLSLPV